jgi:hypothetical protein
MEHNMKRNTDLTTAEPRAADVSMMPPEFIRPADVQKLFGIKRGHLYCLLRDGAIRSVCLRRRGFRSGARLLDVQSIRDFLASCPTEEFYSNKKPTNPTEE